MRIPGITSNEVRQKATKGKQKKGRPPCACFLHSAHAVPQEQQTKKKGKKKIMTFRPGLDWIGLWGRVAWMDFGTTDVSPCWDAGDLPYSRGNPGRSGFNHFIRINYGCGEFE